jgi:hypothetical protein
MAHKGRRYKLWFRRDAAWNLNDYNYGYPEAYYMRFRSPMVSTRWDLHSLSDATAVNLNKTYTRVWTTPPIGGVFDNTYWSIELLGPPDTYALELRFRLKHAALVDLPLFDATYPINQQVFGYELILADTWTTLHFLSPDISLPNNKFFMDIESAGYLRYNP